jgi:choline-sulfatase
LHLIDPHEIHRVPSAELAQFAGEPPSDLDEHAMTQYSERLLANEARTPDGGWDPSLVVPPNHLKWLSAGYDAAVATSDHWLGRLLDRLDELDLSGNTIIAFTSDHGEEFLEHGHLKHGQSLYTELVHIPLIFAGPGIPAGRRVRTPVSNFDLAASLTHAVGVPFGASAAPDLLHPDTLTPQAQFTSTEYGWWNGEASAVLRGMRTDHWSLHYRRIPRDPYPARALDAGRVRLYDLATDPGELHDVASAERARALALVAELERREELLSARRPKAVRSGRGTLQLLQATGYAGQGR